MIYNNLSPQFCTFSHLEQQCEVVWSHKSVAKMGECQDYSDRK